jgi:osmoprotectant transport system substrate-binding protein
MKSTVRHGVTTALLLALALVLAACTSESGGGTEAEAEEGTVASSVDLSDVTITVGSKDFTEQRILGEVMSQALAAAGADVTYQGGLGSAIIRESLTSEEIQAYWEYTGTGWITHLGETTPEEDPEAQFEAVKEADAENGISWFALAPAENTYAIAANEEAIEEFSPTSISDYAEIVTDNPEAGALCTATEWISRDDGLPGMEEHYGFELPRNLVRELDFGPVFQAVAEGDECDFAVVFSTDGLIPANNLTVLEDDQAFYPKYNIAVSMLSDVYDEHAEDYDTLLGAIAEAMTNEKMQELNGQVDVEERDYAEVAEEFLQDEGII